MEEKLTKEEILNKIAECEDIIYHEADYCIADSAMYELKKYQKMLKEYGQEDNH